MTDINKYLAEYISVIIIFEVSFKFKLYSKLVLNFRNEPRRNKSYQYQQ